MLGSNKINSTCPASMKVFEDSTGVVTVSYLGTHIGHSNDIGRMRLTDSEKEEIASKLLKYVPISVILDDIRDSVTDKLERKHLLTRRDLLNLKANYNICMDGKLDAEDATSVDMWVKAMDSCDDSPVVFYKAQGVSHQELLAEDFLLVIMNAAQKQLLNLYGNDVICLDFTHGVNSYNFDLCTVLVLDDKREGFPGAFIITNRQDSIALKLAFQALKDNHIDVSPKVLMTDDAEAFYNAWVSVFGSPEKKLMCMWHVDRIWRKKIQELLKDPALKADVYKTLRCLLAESDEATFNLMINQATFQWANVPEVKEFLEYFMKYYFHRANTWAFCHRKWVGVNTNMHLERMHHTIKYAYLEGKKVKRLDKAIHCLMKFIKDKVFDRLIALEKGKISAKIQILRRRHKAALMIPVDIFIEINENEWEVPSQSRTESYTIRRNAYCCNDCSLLCKEGKFCLHNFTCTCIDNAIQWNMCKHIHYICTNICKQKKAETVTDVDEDNLIIDESNGHGEKNWEVDVHINHLKKHHPSSTNASELKSDINKIYSDIGQFISQDVNTETLREMHKILKTASISLKAHLVNSQAQNFEKCTNYNNEPPNKKIKKQRFFSTKKKNIATLSRNKLVKPTTEEIQNISLLLVMNSKKVTPSSSSMMECVSDFNMERIVQESNSIVNDM